jgi:dihydrofolate reductase
MPVPMERKNVMRKITYYVAASLDGFISGNDGDTSQFVPGGNGVDQYLSDLSAFDAVLMGKATYEFGYRFGLKPGRSPYPHMTNYVFSNTLSFEVKDESLRVMPLSVAFIRAMKNQSGGPIYLCGGGQLAGWMLDHELIDVLKLKLNPFIMGNGIRIFGDSSKGIKASLQSTRQYDHGLQIMTFDLSH